MDNVSSTSRYAMNPLRAFATVILSRAGLSAAEAAVVAESLVEADARGIGSHGVTRLRIYAERLRRGVVQAGVEPKILVEAPAVLHIDAANGMGISAGARVMGWCCERAACSGATFAAVRGGNHFGIGAFFTQRAAAQGFIGFAMTNAPASVVPTGGRQPMLGTNVLSIGLPAGKFPPLILDMATSVVAQGKVILAVKEGLPNIPPGWAIGPDGAPTTDARAALAGAMLPFGGPKGYAIAFIIDLFCSVLAGGNASTTIPSFWKDFEHPQNLGHVFGAIDVSRFLPLEDFRRGMDERLAAMKACATAPGVAEVLLPGEMEHRLAALARTDGVNLGAEVVQDLRQMASEYAVAWPFAPVS